MWRWWRRSSAKGQTADETLKDYAAFKALADADIKLSEAQAAVAESKRWNKRLQEIRNENHFRQLFVDNLGS